VTGDSASGNDHINQDGVSRDRGTLIKATGSIRRLSVRDA